MTKFPIYVLLVLVIVLWIQNLEANPTCERCHTELIRGGSGCRHYNRNADYWKARSRIHDDGQFLTISENDTLLGRLKYELRPPRDTHRHLRPWLEIDWVNVAREGQGIGRALMEYAIENIAIQRNHVDQTVKKEKIGYVRLDLRLNTRNTNASDLYTSLGFKIQKDTEQFQYPRMELDLRDYQSGDSNYTLPTIKKSPYKSKEKCNIL